MIGNCGGTLKILSVGQRYFKKNLTQEQREDTFGGSSKGSTIS